MKIKMDSPRALTKYYFASIKYEEPVYSYMGIHCKTRILDRYDERIRSGTFALDHSPTQKEIISNILNYYYDDDNEDRNAEIICYSPLSEEDYLAYNS